jgi:hypothetical protein
MSRILVGSLLLATAGLAHAQATGDCATAPQPLPVQSDAVPPLSPELVAPRYRLGAPTGVLSDALDEAQSIDSVLLRLRLEGCRVANATPASAPAGALVDPAAYKPKTEFDNTPWRFDMNQNGKRMTAEEFDTWMKARGVRVAKGAKPVAPAAVEVPVEPPATAEEGDKK